MQPIQLQPLAHFRYGILYNAHQLYASQNPTFPCLIETHCMTTLDSFMQVKTKQLSFTGSDRRMALGGGLPSRRSGLRYIGQMGFPWQR